MAQSNPSSSFSEVREQGEAPLNLGLTGALAVWDDLWPPAPASGPAPVYKLLYQSDKQGWPGTCALSMMLKSNQGFFFFFFNGGSVKLIYGGTESLQCFSGFLRTNVMLSLGCWSGKCECCLLEGHFFYAAYQCS